MKKNIRNVIFCPVGIPLNYHDAYDKDNHWRKTNGILRNYETVMYQYNDFDIEKNTYDHLIKKTGFKWELAKHFLDTFDYSDCDYLGFWDDDLVTDIQSINRALEIATQKDIKIFQLSTIAGSESTHRILHQVPDYSYSLTNFNEGMGNFFHFSLIPILLDFWNYHEVKSGWGFDVILSPITKQKAGVIHEVSMYHPNKTSYYDKSTAFAEMSKILSEVYPKFMRDRYNEEVGTYNEPQILYEVTLKA